LSVVTENHVSKKKKMKKRKEKRDDKLKTLSFASIYPREKKKRKSQVCRVEMRGLTLYLSRLLSSSLVVLK